MPNPIDRWAQCVWDTACDVEAATWSIPLAMISCFAVACKFEADFVWLSGSFDTTWLWLSIPLCVFYVRHYRYRCARETTSCLEVAKQGDTAFAAYFCFFLFHLLLTLRVGGAVDWPFWSMVLLPCYGWTIYLAATSQWQIVLGLQAIAIGLRVDDVLPWTWTFIFLPTWAFLAALVLLLPRVLKETEPDFRAVLRLTSSVVCVFAPVLPLAIWLSAKEPFNLYAIFVPWLLPLGNYLVYSMRTLPSTPQSARETTRTRNFSSKLHVPVTSTPGRAHFVDVEADIAGMQQKIREFYMEGDFESALDMATICRDRVAEHFGKDHPVYASTLNNMALMQKNMSQLTEAIATYEEALRVYKECVGESHASFATTLHNLGGVYRLQSHILSGMQKVEALDNALDAFQESLRIRKENLANDHPDIAVGMSNVGMLLWHTHKKDQGEELVVEAMERLQTKLGPDSTLTALAMNNVGIVYKELGKWDEACALFEQVTRVRQEKLGAEHMETITAMHNWAETHRAAGREDAAAAIQTQILDIIGEDSEHEDKPAQN
ncbi:hypothetical protein ACHHYP_04491 [Achlya hypogyna]|uniref:Kinesin light chain n=1 Tax=Achlya hypogyna TaxID=1202772 RepID=A0A1V9Z175_ACHHY|nr:hypothetical protein ACHHYP_04491 [Achlya hypogyna]